MKLTVDIKKELENFRLDMQFETQSLMTGFLGASGSGKSMTLKCIAGIEKPDSGHIELDGRVLFDSNSRINVRPQDRNVGYLFQNYALFPTMDVRKNIMCGLMKVKDKAEKEKIYRQTMSLLQIEELGNRKPWQLSGGQAQRVALARILVNSPSLLLLDEPFSALDAYLRRGLQESLSAILSSVGKQTLIVTHSGREVKRMCTNLFVVDSGSIIRGGKTSEVFENPGSERCALLLEE